MYCACLYIQHTHTRDRGRYVPDIETMFDFRGERVIASVDESLERLGLSYLDCIQV